jgi:hypothetical protein
MYQVIEIMKAMKVNKDEAVRIHDVVDNEGLLDWSEATATQYKTAFRLAQQFIANDYSWEI